MIVVADACPVIFLAKLNRLELVPEVFPGSVIMPETVRRELVQTTIPLHERTRIEAFIHHCRVETVPCSGSGASALSLTDRYVLALATKHPQSRVLTDDGLVRRVALAEGRPVTGTLGLIIRAARAGVMNRPAAIQAVEELVTDHQLRISVALYQEAMRQLQK